MRKQKDRPALVRRRPVHGRGRSATGLERALGQVSETAAGLARTDAGEHGQEWAQAEGVRVHEQEIRTSNYLYGTAPGWPRRVRAEQERERLQAEVERVYVEVPI